MHQTTIHDIIAARISANYFDTARPLDDAHIAELVRLATLAPSAYNLQNWRFVAVRTSEGRRRLQSLAFNQQKVGDAPVTFIVCGTLEAHRALPAALAPSVDQGIIDSDTAAAWVRSAVSGHAGNAQLQRDEAVRSASLAAMTLMLAAQGMGLASGAIGGFDAAGVAAHFDLGKHALPVMLIAVGYAADGNWAPKARKPVAEVLHFA
jgi:nitroreductase